MKVFNYHDINCLTMRACLREFVDKFIKFFNEIKITKTSNGAKTRHAHVYCTCRTKGKTSREKEGEREGREREGRVGGEK